MCGRTVDRLILQRIAALGDNRHNRCFPIRGKCGEGTLQHGARIPGKLAHHLMARKVPDLNEVNEVLVKERQSRLRGTTNREGPEALAFELFPGGPSR